MKNRLIVAVVILLAIWTITGCSKQKPADIPTPPPQNQGLENTAKPKVDENKVNADLTKKLTSEKGVLGGQVYENNDLVTGTIVLEKGTTPEVAKALAQKYLDDIKAQYPGKKINVQAVFDGKNISLDYTP